MSAGRPTGIRFAARPLPAADAAAFVRAGLNQAGASYLVEATVDAPAVTVGERIGRWAQVEPVGVRSCRVAIHCDGFEWAAIALAATGAEFRVDRPSEFADYVAEWGARFQRATRSGVEPVHRWRWRSEAPMTPFELSPEQEAFRRVVRDFATHEIAPNVAAWDRDRYFPVQAVRAMGELGLFGLVAPEAYGGSGAEFTTLCVAIEELGRVDQAIGITLEAAVGLGINPILTYGTDEQKERWLPDLVAGRALAGFGLTEPEAGSDAGATRTRAELDGSDWVINGAKAFITNSGTDITSVVTVTARTGEREISTILVPAGTAGFIVEPAYDKLGWHSSDTHGLTFQDCRVPEDNLLGARGLGFRQFLSVLDDGRIAIAALAVGLAQSCLDLSVQYAKDRTTFGQPIGSRQGVAFPLADLAVSVDAARLLTYRAAALKDAHRPATEIKHAAAIAKLYATEAAVTATRTATQVFGGNGFMEDFEVARFYRDAKILEIGEGTSEVQRMVIARGLGLPVS
jgi:alkylation response protein AidB-like acyl-CoA dehydrogenase